MRSITRHRRSSLDKTARKGVVVASARLDYRRSSPLSERANCCKLRSRPTIFSRTWAGGRGTTPRLWGGGYTFMDRVPGQPLFLVNPNSKFDPTTQLVLNPNAWVEPPYGTFGTSAPYFNDFRWQRQPAESMSFGRIFRIKERCPASDSSGIPEYLQPLVLSGARRRRTVRLPVYIGRHAYSPRQPRRDLVARLRLRELGRWRIDAIRWRAAQVGPARGAIHLLSSSGAGNFGALPPRAFQRGAK